MRVNSEIPVLSNVITAKQASKLSYNQRLALESQPIRQLFLAGRITFEQLELDFNQRNALKSQPICQLFLAGKITFEELKLGYDQRVALENQLKSQEYQFKSQEYQFKSQEYQFKSQEYQLKSLLQDHKNGAIEIMHQASIFYVYLHAITQFRLFLSGESKNALGISNGFFSLLRHKIKEVNVYDKLSERADYIQYCSAVIKVNGSLYDPRLGQNHSFTNFFLMSLYKYDTSAYRKVVGTAYGIVFLEGEVTLFRRDTRHYRSIFSNGFDLKQDDNTASTRKHFYSKSWTYSYGVSTAKVIPSIFYGKGGYFTIAFPKNHQFLLVDIAETARLRGTLNQNPKLVRIQEVNCMQAIPASNIRFFTLEKVHPHQLIANPKAITPAIAPDSKVQYGVY